MNPILKDNFINNKFPLNKISMNENINFSEKIPKKNLPELKLTKLKLRPGAEQESDNNYQNKINSKTGLKYSPFMQIAQKNHTLIKKTELMFPQIRNGRLYNNYHSEKGHNLIVTNYNSNNDYFTFNNANKTSSKRKNIHSQRNAKTKTLYGTYGIKNFNNSINNNNNNINSVNNTNNINNINSININSITINNNIDNIPIQNKNNLNIKINDIEKNNIETYNHNNSNQKYVINLNKYKSKIPKYPKNNKSMPSRINSKMKKIKKELRDKNVSDSLTIHPLITYPKNNNFFGTNNIYNNSDINNNNCNNNLKNNLNTNLKSTNLNQPSFLNSYKSTPSSLPTTNNFSEFELMNERLNILRNLFSSLTSFTGEPNPFFNINQTQKTVELSPEIFTNTYKNFIPSITSSQEEFSEEDIIKGYAFNSSMGNIRDYNEDTITATKIILDNDNIFHFFGVYDGHGGNGCSLYLQNNLHKYIKEFSKEGIKKAINEVEEKFIKNETLNENGEVKDRSGSCGIICMIQNNKCIVANVGDSRLVIYKNNTFFFCTDDHKPDSNVEKERITKAGGKIYQTPSLFPLYQNGKQIEIPWRVLPGRLSVSRTFGDIEAKDEKLGGNKNVVAALPDIYEFILNEEFNLIIIGCDGIFDVLSNEEILECIKIVLKEKKVKEIDIGIRMSELCGDFADMIIKSALAKDSFDNVSCIVIAINIKDLINN